MPDTPDLAPLSVRDLLRLYADILNELVRRGVVRSRNAPAGDLGCWFSGRTAASWLRFRKSWDVRAADGTVLQVKTRLLAAGDRHSHNYSPFRSWDFDACVFLISDAHTQDVASLGKPPMSEASESHPHPTARSPRRRRPDGRDRPGPRGSRPPTAVTAGLSVAHSRQPAT